MPGILPTNHENSISYRYMTRARLRRSLPPPRKVGLRAGSRYSAQVRTRYFQIEETFTRDEIRYLFKEMKLVYREIFPSLMMKILDSTLGR